MNDLAREVLVRAALHGDRQIIGRWHGEVGDCVLGRLHLEMHDDRQAAIACMTADSTLREACLGALASRFGLTMEPAVCCPVCGQNNLKEVFMLATTTMNSPFSTLRGKPHENSGGVRRRHERATRPMA